MANVTKLTHLEHIEDVMLAPKAEGGGVDGCHTAVAWMRQLLKMLGEASASGGFLQTKWDGAPSIVCGQNPLAKENFFIGTKSVFNKGKPLAAFYPEQIKEMYKKAEVQNKLLIAFDLLKDAGIEGVIQGDLMYTPGDVKKETIKGEELLIFKPNTITYAIPENSELGQKVLNSKIGVVFHTPYKGGSIREITAAGGRVAIEKFKAAAWDKGVFVIDNDTPLHDIAVSKTTLEQFEKKISEIDIACAKSGKFINLLVDRFDTSIPGKFHIANYIKSYFNDEVKQGGIVNPNRLVKDIARFYQEQMRKEIKQVSSEKAQEVRRDAYIVGIQYLKQHQSEFISMVKLYKSMQEAKNIVMDSLDKLEKFKTFALTPNGYKVTRPEGYVLHVDGNMIKLIDRLEFAFLNFTLPKQWKS